MEVDLCLVEDKWKIAGILIVVVVEYWLGKTKLVKAASILELAKNGVTKIVSSKTNTEDEMSKEIAKGQLTPEIAYQVTLLDGGSARVDIGYSKAGALLSGGVFLILSAEEVGKILIDKLEQVIPGDQTGIAAMLKQKLHEAMVAQQAQA